MVDPNVIPYSVQLSILEQMVRDTRSMLKWERGEAQYNMDLRKKYERAARLPWLLVPPDPLRSH